MKNLAPTTIIAVLIVSSFFWLGNKNKPEQPNIIKQDQPAVVTPKSNVEPSDKPDKAASIDAPDFVMEKTVKKDQKNITSQWRWAKPKTTFYIKK